MAKTDFSIALRNYAGVPVIELVGEINEKTVTALSDILDKLVQAGHYNVMVNLKRAVWATPSIFKSLEQAAKSIQSHYGNLNLITEMKQMSGIQENSGMSKVMKFCTSEGQALMRIRKLPAATVGGVDSCPINLAD